MAILGFQGSLSIDGADPGFTNLRLGFGHTEVDSTTSLDDGSKAYVKGLFDQYIAADMNIDESEDCATVLDAVQSREPVECEAVLGSGNDAVSISGLMYVFGSEISTGLDEIPSMTVTCRPCPASEVTESTTPISVDDPIPGPVPVVPVETPDESGGA